MRRIIFTLFGVFILAGAVSAATEVSIEFPIPALGNCESEEACFLYCEEPAHYEACFAFGTEHGLLEEEINPELIERIADGGGPGGCTSQVSCEAYCSDSSHLVECVTFAEQHDLMSPEELEEAKKVVAALEAGATLPGGCANKDTCEAYCADASHMQECLSFAEAAGFLSGEELEEAKRMLMLIEDGATPGGCTSQETCESYCQDASHLEECIDFGVKTGFISADEAERIKTSGGGMMGGPGGCKGEEECKAYCQNPANQEECKQFGASQGEGQMMEGPFGEMSGPGGCASPEECMTYCQTHPEECGQIIGGDQQDHEEFIPLMPLEEFMPTEDFVPPSGCSTKEECMNLFGEQPESFEGIMKFEDGGINEFEHLEPQFEMSPDSLFITPPNEMMPGEFPSEFHE